MRWDGDIDHTCEGFGKRLTSSLPLHRPLHLPHRLRPHHRLGAYQDQQLPHETNVRVTAHRMPWMKPVDSMSSHETAIPLADLRCPNLQPSPILPTFPASPSTLMNLPRSERQSFPAQRKTPGSSSQTACADWSQEAHQVHIKESSYINHINHINRPAR
ncbi:uncharacterized protein EKO05_0010820 [Ascochyta rabiei]|uniref:uncharacterized protein n=1 Tax=Didymella rabiei TaxID=5454 RepID=UPI0021FEB9AC|nr:uncharacterized protein EKO05_0010820 [Ascochyta rabiei]UPX20592.1 hypothetical protein EKO05_0010820 [Ascochyta rabiei]